MIGSSAIRTSALRRLLEDLGEGAGGEVPRLRVRAALAAAGRDDDAVGLERSGDVHRVERVGDALLVGRRSVEAGEDEVRHPQSGRPHALGDAGDDVVRDHLLGDPEAVDRPPLELVQPDPDRREAAGGVASMSSDGRQVGRRDPAQPAALQDLALAHAGVPAACSASSVRYSSWWRRTISKPSWSSMSAQACASHSLET